MGKIYFTTASEEQEIIELYTAGNTLAAIAKKYGCAPKTVANRFRKLGIALRTSSQEAHPSITPEREDGIIRSYESGETIASIVKAHQCSSATVYAVLRRRGLRKNRIQVPLTEEEARSTVEAWESGKSIRAISIALDIGYTRIMKHLEDLEYVIERRYKDQKGPANPQWHGGRWISGGRARVQLYEDDPMFCMADIEGTVAEHRLVMARHMDRPLLPWPAETVHHKDGNPLNNSLDNLQLRQGNHGMGIVMGCLDCGSHNIGSLPIADPSDND